MPPGPTTLSSWEGPGLKLKCPLESSLGRKEVGAGMDGDWAFSVSRPPGAPGLSCSAICSSVCLSLPLYLLFLVLITLFPFSSLSSLLPFPTSVSLSAPPFSSFPLSLSCSSPVPLNLAPPPPPHAVSTSVFPPSFLPFLIYLCIACVYLPICLPTYFSIIYLLSSIYPSINPSLSLPPSLFPLDFLHLCLPLSLLSTLPVTPR